MINTVANYIILFASGLSLLMALGQFRRNISRRNLSLVSLLFLTAFIHFFGYLVQTKNIYNVPHFFLIQFPVILSLGTSFIIFIEYFLNPKAEINSKYYFFYTPAVLSIFILFPFFIKSATYKIKLIHDFIDSGNSKVLQMAAIGSMIYNLGLLSFFWFRITKRKLVKLKENKIIAGLILIWFIMFFCMLIIFSTKHLEWITSINLIGVVNIYILYFQSLKHPAFTKENLQKYKKSSLENVNNQKIKEDLELAMKSEKLYTDEELTLKKLSQKLDLSVHQLSEFLNQEYGKNFNLFVNEYRVSAVKKMVLENMEGGITTIAFKSGFSSYSTFHKSFRKQTGMSPADFLKNNLKK